MRPSTLVVIFLIMMNASTGLAVASGFANDAGVQPEACGFDALDDLENSVQQVTANNGLGSTLFGVFAAISSSFKSIWQTATAAPSMMQCIGVPAYITTFVFAPLYLITAVDFAYAMSGRRL